MRSQYSIPGKSTVILDHVFTGTVIAPRDVIPAAEGPLPAVGTKAMGRLMDWCQNAAFMGFDHLSEAADAAGWWARIHGLPFATLTRSVRTGRFVCWE